MLHVALRGRSPADKDSRSQAAKLEEAVALSRAIGLDVVHSAIANLARPTPATLIGSGKVDEMKAVVAGQEVEVVVIDGTLSPVQQRNLERAWNSKVIDRTALILEIFGERAKTKEGRLQVELAHLTYQRSRLVRSWTHLERQRGGFGFLGGPGETQIETDRRLIGQRIAKLRKELDEVKRTRELHRKARRRVPFPVVALVGYTNAGKSTLFNRLTEAEVLAKDLLFATLDPTMRGVVLPGGRKIILSDTVGFISDLPTQLVAAFRATLEEVLEADLVLHVRDAAHEDSEAQKSDVLRVLEELGLDESSPTPVVEILNKIDLIDEDIRKSLLARNKVRPEGAIAVSALTGEGSRDLLSTLDRYLATESIIRVELAIEDGKGLAWAHSHGQVLKRETGEGLIRLTVAASERELANFLRRYPDKVSQVDQRPKRAGEYS